MTTSARVGREREATCYNIMSMKRHWEELSVGDVSLSDRAKSYHTLRQGAMVRSATVQTAPPLAVSFLAFSPSSSGMLRASFHAALRAEVS